MFELYSTILTLCQQWATAGAAQPWITIFRCLPVTATPTVVFDAEIYGVIMAQQTDITIVHKVNVFRIEVGWPFFHLKTLILSQLQLQQLATALSRPLALSQNDEPWLAKDIPQLVCELFLFTELAQRQIEVAAVVIDLIQVFGIDGMALVGFLITLRAHYGLGRAEVMAETQWLMDITYRLIQKTNAYLLSEFVGDWPFPQLVQNLLLENQNAATRWMTEMLAQNKCFILV